MLWGVLFKNKKDILIFGRDVFDISKICYGNNSIKQKRNIDRHAENEEAVVG